MRFLDVKHFLVFFRFFRLFLLHLFALLLNHLFRSTTKNTRILDTSYSCFFLFPMHFFTHLLILSLPNFCKALFFRRLSFDFMNNSGIDSLQEQPPAQIAQGKHQRKCQKSNVNSINLFLQKVIKQNMRQRNHQYAFQN